MLQSLTPVSFSSLNLSQGKIQSSLQDIVNQVQIESNFCIIHPDYKPFQFPEEVSQRFLTLPESFQERYLSLQLRSFLYGIYYNASLRDALAQGGDSPLPIDLENNHFLGVDLAFYQQLDNSNKGTGYFDPDWLILKEETDGSLVVIKGELKLHIDRDTHLCISEKLASVGERVSIRLPKNLVQNGFYMAVGNTGLQSYNPLDSSNITVRIYFNLTPESAVEVMSLLTQHLNELNIPFSFKVLYNPQDYKRYDAGVLYFDKSYYSTIQPILESIYQANQSYFQSEIPLFTKCLAPGMGLAEEPDGKFTTQESFGMNRCQIVANGLLEARQKGDDSPENRLNTILRHFSLLGIDLERPYLNANSEDIYTPLVLGK